MSVRQYSLHNPGPWIDGGVLWLLRVLAPLETTGIAPRGLWGEVLLLSGLFVWFLCLTAFLLLVLDTRALTNAYMFSSSGWNDLPQPTSATGLALSIKEFSLVIAATAHYTWSQQAYVASLRVSCKYG